MSRNPNNFAVTISLSTQDTDLKTAQIAKMLKEGVAIDPNNFCILKGKELLIYALKDFHKRWIEEKNPSEINKSEIEAAPLKKKRNFGAIEPMDRSINPRP